MADRDQPQQPTHKAYTVLKRDGQDDYWLNLGIVIPHKDGKGFNVFTNAWPHDGKLVLREISVDDESPPARSDRNDRSRDDRQQRRGR
jgi:hypothetical protein